MIKGKRGEYGGGNAPYKKGDWVMVCVNSGEQKLGCISQTNMLGGVVSFYERGIGEASVLIRELIIPNTSIACVIPEDVAKNLLLLQGVEL